MSTRLSKLGLAYMSIYQIYIYDFYHAERSLFVISRSIGIIPFISADD